VSLILFIVTTLLVPGAWLYPTRPEHDFTPVGLVCVTFTTSPFGVLCGLFEIAAMRKNTNTNKRRWALSCVGLIGNIVWLAVGLFFLFRFNWSRWAFGH
jgi:hypothetical protein